MRFFWYTFFITLFFCSCNIPLESPTLLRNFSAPASSDEVIAFAHIAAQRSDHISLEVIGQSEKGVDILALRAGESTTTKPVRLLLFAQQHGNEQSGKEALLLLLRDLASGHYDSWLHTMEIWVVPQVNPDGADINERRNASGIDLNRDHVLKNAPETRALHDLFHRVKPHITVDIHEYQPFRSSWKEFGGYKNFDVQVGVTTNLNVDEKLRHFSLSEILPAIENHLNSKGFSFHNYLVGPVPNRGRTRHSTVDIDDGRQSFGILNTLSIIYEGINGPDGFVENLERRTYGQYEALKALLLFVHQNSSHTKNLVESARKKLTHSQPGEKVAIRMEHFPDGIQLVLPLTSSKTGMDTLVLIENYHPDIRALLETERPLAYLVPQNDSLLVSFLDLHRIEYYTDYELNKHSIQSYHIQEIRLSEDEELENRLPQLDIQTLQKVHLADSYLYVPTNQLHANFLVSVFEPQSMLGLAQRDGFQYLLQKGKVFPILRVNNSESDSPRQY